MKCDVAIVGGGPAGTTVGCLLRKYMPHLKVVILEREMFPREHVGESLLPPSTRIINELGVWDKIEEQGFPVKLGATLRWGKNPEFFDFSFIPGERYEDAKRPASFEGQRAKTAFHVDRSIFDKVLLDHAAEMGCKVFEESRVVNVETDGDRVTELQVESDGIQAGRVVARYYVDASGVSGIVRRAFDIPTEAPSALRNIAIYDYWQDADWAKREGVDGTHIQIMSLGWGWLWFITIGKTRSSVGLVTPAEYFKKTGLSRKEIYDKALREETHIAKLLENARCENLLQADRDWSYISERVVGENWLLAGDSSGFADPILSAGITLAMVGSRKVAYTIMELERGEHDAQWLRAEYARTQKQNIANHIRFADYWYSANGLFTELQEYCTEIARDAGLDLDPNEAFRWLGSGGFSDDTWDPHPAAGTYRISAVKRALTRFSGTSAEWELAKSNCLKLNLEGATTEIVAAYRQGRITRVASYRKGNRTLPQDGIYKFVLAALNEGDDVKRVVPNIVNKAKPFMLCTENELFLHILEVLEAMLAEGWIEGSVVEKYGFLSPPTLK